MKRSKLASKVSMLYALLFGATLLLLSAFIMLCTYQVLIGDGKEYLRSAMPSVIKHIGDEIAEGDSIEDPEMLREHAYDTAMNMYILSPEGAPLNVLSHFNLEESLISSAGESVQVHWLEGTIFLSVKKEIIIDDRWLGSLVLISDMGDELSYMRLLGFLLIAVNVLGVLIAVVAGRYVSSKMFRPIQNIIQETAAIDSDNLKRRLPIPDQEDELKSLSAQINTMLDRVEDAFSRQSRFTADASHELRTPLAIIQGYADLLLRWRMLDEEIMDESAEAVSKQTTYMNNLVDNLLLLARGESEKAHINKQNISLYDLLEDLANQHGHVDSHHGYTVQVSKDMRIMADPTMIRQLVSTLLDNSRKYTPDGGKISIIAKNNGNHTLIQVQDTGVGMSKEHVGKIFERFYRVDKSRSREEGSSGLGLSIAAFIVETHKGRIWAESIEGQGTVMHILLPNS